MFDLLSHLLAALAGVAGTIGVMEFVSWRREVRESTAEDERDAAWDREHGIGEAQR